MESRQIYQVPKPVFYWKDCIPTWYWVIGPQLSKASEQWLRGILGTGAGWGARAGWSRRLKERKQGGAHEGPAGAERKSAQECRHRTPRPGACHKRPSGQMCQPCSSNGKVTPNKELIHSVFQEKAKWGSTAFMKAIPITQDVSNVLF